MMILIKLMKINVPEENRDFAGVQPWQDPGGTLGMNGVGERERTLVGPRERERESVCR